MLKLQPAYSRVFIAQTFNQNKSSGVLFFQKRHLNMDNIFKHKYTDEEVSLIHMGKMYHTNETVAIYELAEDKTIRVMTLSEFNHAYEQNDYEQHSHYTQPDQVRSLRVQRKI